MMKRIWYAAIIGVTLFITLVAPMSPVYAQGGACEPKQRFLTFPTWWRGLSMDSNCSINFSPRFENDIIKIVANIVEIILQLVGYVAVAYIIVGGFHYITGGAIDQQMKARKTIQNAIIGLILSLLSVGIINFVAAGL